MEFFHKAYPCHTIGLGSEGIRNILDFWDRLGLIDHHRYVFDLDYYTKWQLLGMLFARDERW